MLAARPDRGAARRLRCLPGRAGDGHHVALGLRQNARELADLGGLYRTVSVHHGERASRPGDAKPLQGPIYLGYPERGRFSNVNVLLITMTLTGA